MVAAVADALLSGSVGMITIQSSSTSWILFQTSQFHCLHFLAVTRTELRMRSQNTYRKTHTADYTDNRYINTPLRLASVTLQLGSNKLYNKLQ